MTVLEYEDSVKLYEDKIYSFILKNIRNREVTKDIVQDAFMKLWVNKEKVEVPKAKSWLFTTAHNYMVNIIKRDKKFTRPLEPIDVGVDDKSESFDHKGFILTELKKLTKVQQRVIILRDIHGYNYSEIGERTNLTKSQVKVYIFRGRKILKDRLKGLTH